MKLFRKLLIFGAICTQGLSAAKADWIGAFLYRNYQNDHIHITVAEDGRFDRASMLNVWNDYAVERSSMTKETEMASDFLIFRDTKQKSEIDQEWTGFFELN